MYANGCSVVIGVSHEFDHTPRFCGYHTRVADLRASEEVETSIRQSARHWFYDHQLVLHDRLNIT
jgi:hypothetical protein